jgi:hypothetical protein
VATDKIGIISKCVHRAVLKYIFKYLGNYQVKQLKNHKQSHRKYSTDLIFYQLTFKLISGKTVPLRPDFRYSDTLCLIIGQNRYFLILLCVLITRVRLEVVEPKVDITLREKKCKRRLKHKSRQTASF